MVVIFGWGSGEARDLGEVAPLVCPNCHNQVFLHQIHSEKKVSLYFVPLASYGSNEYLACPICRAGLEIGPQHTAVVGGMRLTTQTFRQGVMAQPQYQGIVDRFWQTMGISPGGQPVGAGGPVPASAAPPASAPSPSPQAPASPLTVTDRLTDLAKLHAAGVLTDEEFTAAKRRLLEE